MSESRERLANPNQRLDQLRERFAEETSRFLERRLPVENQQWPLDKPRNSGGRGGFPQSAAASAAPVAAVVKRLPGDVVVVRILPDDSGAVYNEQVSALVKPLLDAASTQHTGPVVLDLSQVDWLAASFLSLLVAVRDRLRPRIAHPWVISLAFHVLALGFRLFFDLKLLEGGNLSSPGMDEVRWLKPLRPGDAIRMTATVVELRPSRSKPDRGIVVMNHALVNQAGATIMTVRCMHFLRRKPGA